VLAVELDRQAVRDAAHNLGFVEDAEDSAEFPWVDLVEGSVDDVMADASYMPDHADVVVLDPPRAGAGRDVCVRIAGLSPRAVAYVACDPASLARDVAYFMESGYELTNLRAFDLFPMTRHVECVALLEPAQR
jgi:tRNA/tmRNA/rRNA uracil-C5-methylase (TrmA/RlmC/RlmD family)